MAIRNSSSTPKSSSVTSSADWTRSFQLAQSRRSVSLSICTMTACALLLPVVFANRTYAEPNTPRIVLNAQTTPYAASTPEASPLNSLATPLPPAPGTVAASVAPTVVAPVSPAKTRVAAPAARAATPVSLTALAPITAVVAGKTQKAFILPADNMTVGEALSVLGVSLSNFDRAVPDAADKFTPGMTIRVTRISIENVVRRESIAAEVRYQPTTSLSPGASKTTQSPRAGYREITERVYTKNGVETLRKPVSSAIGQEPQHRIIALGVSPRFMPRAIKPHPRYAKALTYRGGGPRDRAAYANNSGAAPMLRIAKTLKMETTAYQGGEPGGGGSRTATGMRVGYGAIAVDPRVVPLGSKLYVEGYGYGFACDTGGAIKGHRLDLAMPSNSQCNAYGRKRGVTVYILSE